MMRLEYELGGVLDHIEFDAVIREQYSSSAQVTEHPVERGSAVTDHIRGMPARISVEAVISNTPLFVPKSHMNGVAGGVRQKQFAVPFTRRNEQGQIETGTLAFGANLLQFDGFVDRVRDVYGKMHELVVSGAIVDIKGMGDDGKGSYRDFTSMAITSMSAPRESKDGSCITFSFEAVEVRIVDTQKVATPAPKAARANRGKKSKQELDATKDAKKKSAIKAIKDRAAEALHKAGY